MMVDGKIFSRCCFPVNALNVIIYSLQRDPPGSVLYGGEKNDLFRGIFIA